MSWLNELDVFTFGTTLLQFIGEYNEYTSKKVIAFRVTNCAVLVMLLTFILSNMNDPKSQEFVTSLDDFSVVFHTLFKYLMFMYNKNELTQIMDAKVEKFWKIPHRSEDLSRKVADIYKRINLLQIAMLADVIPILEIYVLGPYFNPSNPFIFASNVFVDSITLDAAVLFCQYYLIVIIAFIVIGYDFIYLSLCTELRVQVKLLKYKLREVFTETSKDAAYGVWNCVAHHNFLLSTYDRMQKMYSNTLLFHYFSSLVIICFDIYQFFIGEGVLSHEVQKLLTLTAIIGQFAFYCVPAELLSAEFIDIARALYLSNWYKNRPNIQKLMLPIMVKCQRSHYFSAAGLLDINIDALGSVIRKAFSFCAVMRNVLNK